MIISTCCLPKPFQTNCTTVATVHNYIPLIFIAVLGWIWISLHLVPTSSCILLYSSLMSVGLLVETKLHALTLGIMEILFGDGDTNNMGNYIKMLGNHRWLMSPSFRGQFQSLWSFGFLDPKIAEITDSPERLQLLELFPWIYILSSLSFTLNRHSATGKVLLSLFDGQEQKLRIPFLQSPIDFPKSYIKTEDVPLVSNSRWCKSGTNDYQSSH